MLFANLANYISLNFDHIQVFIIDFKGGALWNNIISNRVKKIPFIEGKDCIPVKDSFLIMQALVLSTIRSELKITREQKIFFWHLHPYNYQLNNLLKVDILDKIVNEFRVAEKKKIKEYIEIINDLNGLAFMDGSNYQKTRDSFSLTIKENYLPITNLKPALKPEKRDTNSVTHINISFIGRLTTFKYYPLVKLLELLDVFVVQNKDYPRIKFFVIGEGEYRDKLVDVIDGLQFEVVLLGERSYSDLQGIFLSYDIGLNFAMGTSALDSACRGIPTVILDYSYTKIDGYPSYDWIFNQPKFSLAMELSDNNLAVDNELTLDSLMKEFIISREIISSMTINYYETNYDINAVSKLLLDSLGRCDLRFGDIQKYSKKSIVRKSYEYWKRI